eukprot:TRINITY_DN102483_c0_g1_i1.p1 TRINITY_DN102483_c0_g1~~TRINITY_DN102483_c0_g1_i1.p1  ORF type:complete len:503 (-),score=117.31 TRINITY_DN102483_c0_g1_i1:60-1568(-)
MTAEEPGDDPDTQVGHDASARAGGQDSAGKQTADATEASRSADSNAGAAAPAAAPPDASAVEGTAQPPLTPVPPPAAARGPPRPGPVPRPLLALELDDEESCYGGFASPASTAALPRGCGLRSLPTSPRPPQVSPPTVAAGAESAKSPASPAGDPVDGSGKSPGGDGGAASGAEKIQVQHEKEYPERINYSERALREASLLEMLPWREFTFDENGKLLVVMDDEAQPSATQGPVGEDAESAEAWKSFKQRRIDLALIRSHFAEWISIHGSRKPLPQQVESQVSVPQADGLQLTAWSSPPPTPSYKSARPRGAARMKMAKSRDLQSNDTHRTHVDDKFRDRCAELGIPAHQLACQAVAAIETGGMALPRDFKTTAYLGNRCAEALFWTFVRACESSGVTPMCNLSELKALDLSGQGIANEAAKALSELLEYCPKLEELNLARNSISEAGAKALLSIVSVHPRLVDVCLDHNPMPSWIRVKIRDITKKRQQMFEKFDKAQAEGG